MSRKKLILKFIKKSYFFENKLKEKICQTNLNEENT